MAKKTVGAFEAKTHFSQLLKEVEQGTVIHVTRRGKSVAILSSAEREGGQAAYRALERISLRRESLATREILSTDEILALRDVGRR